MNGVSSSLLSFDGFMDYINLRRPKFINYGMKRYGLQETDVESCLNTSCFDVSQKLDKFVDKTDKDVSRYFMTCFSRDCCDCARGKYSDKNRCFGDLELFESGSLNPVEKLLRDESAERVYCLLSKLNDLDRFLIQLRVDGFSPRKIAQVVSLPVKTIHSRMSRARARLRRELDS